LKSKLAYKEIL